jgi:hypothetical protein
MSSQPWLKYFPGDEFTDDRLRVLRPECRALVIDFRAIMWKRNGLEDNDQHLETLAKELCGFSRYRFRKYWPTLKKIFTVIDGKLFFDRDEEQRGEMQEEFAKRQKISSIANSARWQSKRQAATASAESVVENSSMMDFDRDPCRSRAEGEAYTEGDSAAAAVECTVVGAAAAGSSSDQIDENTRLPSVDCVQESRTIDYFRVLALRCAGLGIPAPGPSLAFKIFKRFPDFDPSTLPLFPTQKSPGLWLLKSVSEIGFEIARQTKTLERKPTAKEQRTQENIHGAVSETFGGT